jgi:hypothetical protein
MEAAAAEEAEKCWMLEKGRKQEQIHGAYKVYRSEMLNCYREGVWRIC